MGIIFQLIVVAGILKYCTKATFFRGYRGILLYSVIGGAIAIASYPVILHTDSDVFDKLMSDKNAVSNMAVLITIEAITGMFVSIGMLNNQYSAKTNKWIKMVKLLPGMLIVGIVFYAGLSLFRSMAGTSFHWIALTASISVMLGVFVLSVVLKFSLPEISTRYEMKFLVNILLLVLAIFLNAGLADYNTSHYQADVDYTKLLAFLGMAIAGFIAGYLLFKNKKIIQKFLKYK